MAGSTIGIKIADGSYYPVLEESFTGTKRLTLTTKVASGSGVISFSNAAWSTRRFQVYQQAAAPQDTTPPQITGVTRATASPLDTSASFGWVNVSCTVTDNVAVS